MSIWKVALRKVTGQQLALICTCLPFIHFGLILTILLLLLLLSSTACSPLPPPYCCPSSFPLLHLLLSTVFRPSSLLFVSPFPVQHKRRRRTSFHVAQSRAGMAHVHMYTSPALADVLQARGPTLPCCPGRHGVLQSHSLFSF